MKQRIVIEIDDLTWSMRGEMEGQPGFDPFVCADLLKALNKLPCERGYRWAFVESTGGTMAFRQVLRVSVRKGVKQ